MIISHKYKIIFFHIPKNAGTFIWINIFNVIDKDIEIIKDAKYNTHHVKPKDNFNILYKYKNYKTFCVVRNPYTSIISLYNFIKRSGPPVYSGNAYPLYEYFNSLTFNEFVKSGFLKVNNHDILLTNYNFQKEWVYDNDNNQIIDHIIKFENLQDELTNFLLENNVDKELLDKLNYDKLNQNEKNVNLNEYYNDDLITWIKTFIPEFNEDLNLFGYTNDVPKISDIQEKD